MANQSRLRRVVRGSLVVIGSLVAAFVIAGVLTAISSMAPEERAACDRIESEPYSALKGWLERPENWMTASDLAGLEWSDRKALASTIAEEQGCPEPDGALAALDTYVSTNDFDEIWPAGCKFTEAAPGDRTAVVLPGVQEFVNTHPELTVIDWNPDAFSADVDAVLAGVGCELLLADEVHDAGARYAVETAISSLLHERYRLATVSAPGTSVHDQGTWDVNVNVPDLNPFYCSWSIRGGFNCGIH